MKNVVFAVLAILVGFGISVWVIAPYLSDAPTKENVAASEGKSDDKEGLVKDITAWREYSKTHVDLMSSFRPLDDAGAEISKSMFLNLLKSGIYMPVHLTTEKELTFQLQRLPKTTAPKVVKKIKSDAIIANHYLSMEGRKLPEYTFVDLQGKGFNKEDTQGKLLVLKCWFITCKVCVEEFPELNELVDAYRGQDVAFVSLAFDEKEKLKTFLARKEFKYATIPLQKKYMSKKLKVKQYPTHLIVAEDGTILKMVNNVKTLRKELERILPLHSAAN